MNILSGLFTMLGTLIGFALSVVSAIINAIMGAWTQLDPGTANTDAAMHFWSYCSDYIDPTGLSVVVRIGVGVLGFSMVVKFLMWIAKLIPGL